jgi:hypothetical protein
MRGKSDDVRSIHKSRGVFDAGSIFWGRTAVTEIIN